QDLCRGYHSTSHWAIKWQRSETGSALRPQKIGEPVRRLSIDPANDRAFFTPASRKRHFLQVSLDFVSVVIFAAAFSSYADMIQLRSEQESWRILLRIRQSPELFSLRPRIRGPKHSLFHS